MSTCFTEGQVRGSGPSLSPHQPGGNRAAAAGEEQDHPGREGTPWTGGAGGDRGRPGQEGTPRTGGDGAGAAQTAMKQVRPAGDADACRQVRADKSISGVACEPHVWNHLEGPPGRLQSQGAGPRICIFKQLLQVDSKFDSLRGRGGGTVGCR